MRFCCMLIRDGIPQLWIAFLLRISFYMLLYSVIRGESGILD